MRKLELLCPAKNLEAGKLAINYGADAVYIGAKKFGARAAAGNSVKEIEELCKYSHLYNASVYVALNTLIFENELEEAEILIKQLSEVGIDALIIQDMGILEMDIPPLRLFASTQTNNYSLDRIQFLEGAGFERLILARELSINQIREIRNATKIDLESFIFGALCVSFSGQCYMSSAISGRSANRGMCLQACRLPYDLLNANGDAIKENKHLLSLKDFNASMYISDLIDAGVSSFKIEGRLKNNAYVINNTAYFRTLIDNLLEQKNGFVKYSSGKTKLSFTPDPEKTFNRGFTSHFLSERQEGMISPETPKSLGKFIGIVKEIKGDRIIINTSEQINNGDGICFVNENNDLAGFLVNAADSNSILPNSFQEIIPGTKLFRNLDVKFVKLLENNRDKRSISVNISLSEVPEGFIITAIDEDNNKSSLELKLAKTLAENQEKSLQTINKQLGKSGDTIFEIANIEIDKRFKWFLPISVINQGRREVLELLMEARLNNYVVKKASSSKGDISIDKYLDFTYNISNSLAEKFYKNAGADNIELALEVSTHNSQINKVLMTTKYCIKYELGACEKLQTKGKKLFNEPLFLQQGNRKFRIDFDCKNCVMKIKEND